MDNQNQNTGFVSDGTVRPAPGLDVTAIGSLNPEASALSTDPNSLSQQPAQAPLQPSRNIRGIWTRMLRRADLVVLALIIIGAAVLVITASQKDKATEKNNSAGGVASQYTTQQVPLNGFVASNNGVSFGPSNVFINGALSLNGGLVITPSVQPNAPKAGQLYYDQNTNQLAYYNGTIFVPLPGDGTVVQSIGGATGTLTLGGGLSVVGNQLTVTQQPQTGVTSFGSANGAITVGGGLNMAGNTLQNSGVLNILPGSSIAVTDDGNGNFTVSNTGSGTGTVSSSGGTTGALPLFTASQNIEDSVITQSGTMITITGDLNVVTGGLSLGNALTVSNGGTGAASLAANGVVVASGTAPLTSVTAGASGLCFVSTAGAPTFAACPSASGVSSLNGLTGALSIANASGAGSVVTIDNASTGAKGIASFNAANFTAAAGVINTIQDINTTAVPTFARLTVTSSQNTNPMLVVNNTDALATGNLLDLQQNGTSRFSVQPNGNTTIAGTINGQTISNTANFTGTLGVAGATTLSGVLNANGGSINSAGALNITPGGTLTVGATGQTLALQGNTASSFAVVNGGNTTTVSFQAPTANVTYRYATAAAGSYDICTTAGNCAGGGGGVTTLGGTTNRLSKFTGASTLGDSSITDNGTLVTTSANVVIQGGTATVGVANSQTGSLTLAYGSANFSGTVIQGALTANRTYTLPDFDGTFCLSSGNCLGGGGGGANTALSNLSSVAINTSLLPGSTSIDLGSAGAPFRSLFIAGSSLTPGTNNFEVTGTATAPRTITLPDSSGTVCLNNSVNCGFLTGTGTAFVQNGNTFGAAGNLGTNDGFALNLRTSGTTRLTVASGGDVTFSNNVLINGGQLGSTGALAINPAGSLTAGSASQGLTLQGNATTTVTASDSGNTTTVSFQVPTANVTYRFATTIAGSYDVCTTAGNCVGVGGGVSSAGGTTGTIAVFTGAQTIGDSLLSQAGGTVGVNGNLNLTTGNQYRINGAQISSGNLSNDANLAKLNASQTFTGNTVAFKNAGDSANAFNIQNAGGNRILTVDTTGGQTVLGLANTLDGKLVFSNVSNANTITIVPGTPSANRTLTLPNADGVLCTDSGNCAGAGATLQTGYNFSTGGTTPKIKVNSSLLGVDIQDADTTIGANLFNVRASNGAGLGQVMLGVSSTGQLTVQNGSNSTTALRFLTQGGTAVLTGDTQNGQIILGQGGTLGGALVFNNATNANQISLVSAVASGAQTITLPNSTGTVCLSSGNCSGSGSSNTLQAAYDAGNTILTSNARDINFALADSATDANMLIDLQCDTSCSTNGRFAVQDDGVDVFKISPAGGALLFQPTVDSTTAFNVKSQVSGGNLFTVDTVNGRVGVNLESNNVPDINAVGLQVRGSLKISGSGSSAFRDTYSTPLGSGLQTRLSIANENLPASASSIYVGLLSTADPTARGITVLDARTVSHQPSLGVISPNENDIFGLSWDGSNTNAYLKSSASNIFVSAGGVDVIGAATTAVNLLQNTTVAATKTFTVTSGLTTLTGNTTGDALNVSNSTSTGNIAVFKDNTTTVATLADGGALTLRNSVDSTGAFKVQNAASGNEVFTVDTSGNQIVLGKASTVNGKVVFQGSTNANTVSLQSGATATSYDLTLPTAVGATNDCLTTNNSTGQLAFDRCGLQDAYENLNSIATLNARNIVFILQDSATDSNFIVNMQCVTSCGTDGRFVVQNNSTSVFWINPGTLGGQKGSAVFKNSANDTLAFQIQDSGSIPLFSVDTTNKRVRVGDSTADTTGTILVLDTKTDATDPNGVNGAMYYNSALHQYRCYRGVSATAGDGAWEPCGVNPIDRGFVMEEEFLGGFNSGGVIGQLGWTKETVGAPVISYNTGLVPTADHPGTIEIDTTATSGNGLTLTPDPSSSGSIVIAPGNVVKSTAGMDTTLANSVMRIGLHGELASSARSNSGVWWEAAPTVNSRWQFCYGNGATPICSTAGSTTPTIATAQWYRLEIRVTATGSGTSAADFFIDGVKFSVSGVTIDTTARVNPAISCFTTTNASRFCNIDYFQFRGTTSAAR